MAARRLPRVPQRVAGHGRLRASHRDVELRERLERAIEGRGAFRRFRDLVHEEGLAQQWDAFSADRQAGRARRWLADEGIRVG